VVEEVIYQTDLDKLPPNNERSGIGQPTHLKDIMGYQDRACSFLICCTFYYMLD
jgi:hypothetical protein